MAGVKEQSVYTFSTSSGGQTYQYDIVVDSQGEVSARNFRTPWGLITDPYTSLPAEVLQDIYDAEAQIAQQNAEFEVASGTATFTGQTEQVVVLAGGLLNNTNYRVVYTTSDDVPLRTTGKTVTGFTIEAAIIYGSVADPKDVGYSVLVQTAGASVYGGTATILEANGGAETITFPTAMTTEDYRVIMSPDDFFPVYLSSKTKAGFTIHVGYTMETGTSVTVGYDVFV